MEGNAKLLVQLRRTLAGLVLRGPLLSWRLAQLCRKFAKEYVRKIRELYSSPVQSARPVPVRSPRIERILFLCDNMWEKRELAPELRKIAETDFLDVKPWKKRASRVRDEKLDLDLLLPYMEQNLTANYDVIIVYLNAALLSEELLSLCRKKCVGLLIGMNLDDKGNFEEFDSFTSEAHGYRRWAGKFDANLSNSRTFVDIYNILGFSCLYLPTGFHCDPLIHQSPRAGEFQRRFAFAGSRKPERAVLVERLRAAGIEISVYGSGWPNAQFLDDAVGLYRSSQINLGIGYNLPGSQITNLKNRDFECPGAGGCYLTTFDWELAQMFEVGKEILCYRDFEDLVEIYLYHLKRPELCLEIGRAGFERSKNDHTWEKRFRAIFKELGFAA